MSTIDGTCSPALSLLSADVGRRVGPDGEVVRRRLTVRLSVSVRRLFYLTRRVDRSKPHPTDSVGDDVPSFSEDIAHRRASRHSHVWITFVPLTCRSLNLPPPVLTKSASTESSRYQHCHRVTGPGALLIPVHSWKPPSYTSLPPQMLRELFQDRLEAVSSTRHMTVAVCKHCKPSWALIEVTS